MYPSIAALAKVAAIAPRFKLRCVVARRPIALAFLPEARFEPLRKVR